VAVTLPLRVQSVGQAALDAAALHPEMTILWPFKHLRASINHYKCGELLIRSLMPRVMSCLNLLLQGSFCIRFITIPKAWHILKSRPGAR